MPAKIALGEYSSKQRSDFEIVLLEEELNDRIFEGRASYDVIDEPTEIANCIRDDISHIADEQVEVHTTLQGEFSADFYGVVVNQLRYNNKIVSVIIYQLPENIRDQSRSPKVAFAGETKYKNLIANPSKNPDFFDLLRDLDSAAKALMLEIRGINDPERLTANVKAAAAYIEAFRAFLDDHDGLAPEQVPSEIPGGLLKHMRSVNWATISSHAQKWAETISKILEKFLQ